MLLASNGCVARNLTITARSSPGFVRPSRSFIPIAIEGRSPRSCASSRILPVLRPILRVVLRVFRGLPVALLAH
jgi:hypothetical protein